MLNVNLKSNAVMLITKKYYFTLLGNHISHNFTIHINKHNTRRVAVYLETHCNIGLKRAFTTGVLDK